MEYYIRRVIIQDLFEPKNDYRIDLSEGSNCIYGSNGTGKTTIINLIVNCLNVELEAIAKTPFSSISIDLAKTGQVRAIKFLKLSKSNISLSLDTEIEYEIESSNSHRFSIASR